MVSELTVHMFEDNHEGLSLQHQAYMSIMLWWAQIKQNSRNGTFNIFSKPLMEVIRTSPELKV